MMLQPLNKSTLKKYGLQDINERATDHEQSIPDLANYKYTEKQQQQALPPHQSNQFINLGGGLVLKRGGGLN